MALGPCILLVTLKGQDEKIFPSNLHSLYYSNSYFIILIMVAIRKSIALVMGTCGKQLRDKEDLLLVNIVLCFLRYIKHSEMCSMFIKIHLGILLEIL